MPRLMIDVPKPIKAKLKELKKQGYTMNGFIVALLEREFSNQKPATKKGEK